MRWKQKILDSFRNGAETSVDVATDHGASVRVASAMLCHGARDGWLRRVGRVDGRGPGRPATRFELVD